MPLANQGVIRLTLGRRHKSRRNELCVSLCACVCAWREGGWLAVTASRPLMLLRTTLTYETRDLCVRIPGPGLFAGI